MGHNLPLKTRRALARGIGPRTLRAWSSRKHTGDGNRAALTTALAGANNDITLIAKSPGTGGNSVTFRIVVSGNNTPLSVSVAGSAITVNSATNGSAAATSPAAEVVSALKASSGASALVWPAIAAGNDGTGVVTALTATNLAGAV